MPHDDRSIHPCPTDGVTPTVGQPPTLAAFTAELHRVFPHLEWTAKQLDVEHERSYHAQAATERAAISIIWAEGDFLSPTARWNLEVQPFEDYADTLDNAHRATLGHVTELLTGRPTALPADQRDGWSLIALTTDDRARLARLASDAADRERAGIINDPKKPKRRAEWLDLAARIEAPDQRDTDEMPRPIAPPDTEQDTADAALDQWAANRGITPCPSCGRRVHRTDCPSITGWPSPAPKGEAR